MSNKPTLGERSKGSGDNKPDNPIILRETTNIGIELTKYEYPGGVIVWYVNGVEVEYWTLRPDGDQEYFSYKSK